jgi:creatinine amidohydrolase
MKHALQDMTFAEVRERLSSAGPGGPVVLLPFGSQENQGPHAPMGDFMLAEAIATRAAEATGAIVAPVIPFGHADYFRCFAGGIQLRASTFSALVEDMVDSLLDHGFERLLLVNGHSGNVALIDQVARRTRRERGVAIASIDLWRSLPDSLWQRLHGDDWARAKGHGGEPLTSVYTYLCPDLVRRDMIRPSGKGRAMGLPMSGPAGVIFQGQAVNLPLEADEVNADGMLGGDATRASAEVGKQVVDHLVGLIAGFARHLAGCDPRDLGAGPA